MKKWIPYNNDEDKKEHKKFPSCFIISQYQFFLEHFANQTSTNQ